MKKSLHFIIFLTVSLLTGFSLAGCDDGDLIEETIDGYASISIEYQDIPEHGYTKLIFKPNDLTAKFICAVGDESDRSNFEDQNMKGIETFEGNGVQEIIVKDLESGKPYTVFAMPFDAEENRGRIASVKFIPFQTEGLYMSTQYVSDVSLGLEVLMADENYCRYSYAIGLESDRAAFEAGTLEGIRFRNENPRYVVSWFDLEPDTDYTVFFKAYNRMNDEFKYYDYPVKTFPAGASPEAKLEIAHIDVLYGNIIFTPNSQCSKYAVFMGNPGEYEFLTGDIMGEIANVARQAAWFDGGKVGQMILDYSTKMMPDVKTDAYIVTFDENGEPANVKYHEISTPPYDKNGSLGTVSIEITDVTHEGATMNMEISDNTLICVTESIKEFIWKEAFAEAFAKGDEEYIREQLLLAKSANVHYKNPGDPNTYSFTETKASPNTKYIVVGWTMNQNGMMGVGDMVYSEYTTLPKPPVTEE